MNIIVCIKQVPASSNVKVDPVTGVLIRDGVDSKMNPYDLYALETALTLREAVGGTVKVISMGPGAAMAVLKEALYMGADEGVLISDRRLGGADVLATAYTLSSAVKALGQVDLVLCGKQTTDGDTAQVGAEMAEYLGFPQYSNVHTALVKDGKLEIVSELGRTVLTAQVEMPALICTDAEINTPRLPSYLRKKEIDSKEGLLKTITLDDFEDHDPAHYGLKGSATSVEKIFPPEKSDEHLWLTGEDGPVSDKVYEILKNKKLI